MLHKAVSANLHMYDCAACGYSYMEETTPDGIRNYGTPFIEVTDKLLYVKSIEFDSDKIVKLSQYICPQCGILQVCTTDLE